MVEKLINLVLVLVIIGFGVSIYCFLKYANTPLSEVPLWVAWFMFSK